MIARVLTACVISTFLAVGASHADWEVVTGEQSFVSSMKDGIERDNLYCVFRYNTETGEVHWLRTTYGSNTILENWVRVRAPSDSAGEWELVTGEYSLLEYVGQADVETENLYGALLLETRSGALLRLMMMNNGSRISAEWRKVEAPPRATRGTWRIVLGEQSVASFGGDDFDRTGIYSIFICDPMSGTVLRLESWYSSDGSIKERWVSG